ncbi:dsRBD fold-containing protein [Georgenia muralis]|uniref:Uncharacterized protein DUF1876 n=1 Tax=Georgenia muralis TaxID=154117 RepID=A0A3N4YZ98_9MICO|nr:dsRBD fold-containing protein [Georgenia muralis]RPF26469.1 uncharacterized protein DUF1876 [Georgenia muralis]
MAHTWKVQIDLFNAGEVRSDEPLTTAHATLTTSAGTTLNGYGRARRNPGDPDVPEVGEELAAARALRDLADRLLRASSDDISALEHHRVHLAR